MQSAWRSMYAALVSGRRVMAPPDCGMVYVGCSLSQRRRMSRGGATKTQVDPRVPIAEPVMEANTARLPFLAIARRLGPQN